MEVTSLNIFRSYCLLKNSPRTRGFNINIISCIRHHASSQRYFFILLISEVFVIVIEGYSILDSFYSPIALPLDVVFQNTKVRLCHGLCSGWRPTCGASSLGPTSWFIVWCQLVVIGGSGPGVCVWVWSDRVRIPRLGILKSDCPWFLETIPLLRSVRMIFWDSIVLFESLKLSVKS